MDDHSPGEPAGDGADSPESGADITWLGPEGAGPDPDTAGAPIVVCWRCGKRVDAGRATCPHCRARLDPYADPADPRRDARGRAVVILLGVYLVFLVTSVVYASTIKVDRSRETPMTDEEVRDLLVKTVIIEAVDAVLVVVGIVWAHRPPSPPRIGPGRRIAAWLVAAPALAALLAANFAYIRIVREALGLPTIEFGTAPRHDLLAWIVLTICVQPAIVEELFFRYLALGHLRPVVGTHGAVLVSSAMFGLAHLFSPLGIPYLIVAGFVFGYARVLGRGLALPMLLHFAHNAAVIFWSDTWI